MAVPTFNIPSKTETSLNNIISGGFQSEKPKKTQTDFYKKVDKFVASGKFTTEEEAFKEAAKAAVHFGDSFEGIDLQAIITPKPVEQEEIKQEAPSGILNTVGEGLTGIKNTTDDVIGGAISNVPNIIGNTFGFLADVVTPKQFEGLGDSLRESGIRQQSDLQEMLGVDAESFATSAGEFGSDVGTLFIPGGQAKLVAKFPQASEKIAKLGNAIESLGQKAPKVFNTLKSAVTGAKEVGKFETVTEGEVTPEGLAVGAIANPLIGKTIQGIGKISKGVAEKLEVMGLLNPAKLNIVGEQLKTKGVENLSVADYLLKNKIKGTKENIITQLETLAKKSKQEVDEGIESVKGLYKNDSVDEILQFLRKDLSEVPGQAPTVNRISELFAKSKNGEGLTLKEVNEVKRIADQQLSLFTVAGDVKAGATKQGLTNLRGDIQKFIENTAEKAGVKNIKQSNKNTQVNRTLIDAITKKDSADQARELLTAFAPGGIGAIGGAFAPSSDPFETLKNIVIGGAVGQVAGSTRIKTNVANILNKLKPLEKESLIKFIETKGATPISSEIIELIQ